MRCRIRSILSDTLAPPRTATYGFSGWSRRRDRDAISASISRPAAGRGRCRVIPTTEACARWAVPKASFTYRSASAASLREKASSFFSSSGWKRRFSSTSDSPACRPRARPSTSSPMQSGAISTLVPRREARCAATGRRLISGARLPFGRPRCEAITGRPPRSRISFRVGSEARTRVSSETPPSFKGTLKSTRTNTRRPSTSRSRTDSLRVFTSASARRTGGPQVTDEVGQTVHVPPLVVVPCEDLQEIPAVDGQERPVDDRRTAVAQIIDRNQFLVAVPEDTAQPSLRRPPERAARLLQGRGASQHHRQVDERHRGRRHAYRQAAHLPR